MVLAFNKRFDDYAAQQRKGEWQPLPYCPPWELKVGILGLGELGLCAAKLLKHIGYDVAGWSRTPKDIEGLRCYAGAQRLAEMLARSQVLVCLLPLTPSTRGILNASLFQQLPRGAYVINCARGGHLVESDLMAALDEGHLAGAALDVFEEEPLPAGHPFWKHPEIAVTPHASAPTIPDTAILSVGESIARFEAGEGLRYVVDFKRGY